ncbi:hypothetical protein [Oleisolibacter albus]|uniref:hypothetical protein n=1 Tax=Oleisolibacter albus TaxID=2171757 RepID=UPI000DF2EA25|nr:hypothetical protein [Oleisolibacter albus]
MAGTHTAPVVSEKIVREHAEGWQSFTRFTTVAIIFVTLILLMFLLHFFVGWGYALFLMVLGFIATIVSAVLGKI